MKELFTTLHQNRLLIFELARRDIRDRYVGQIFGYVWFLINSIFTISVYIFLFAFVYKSKAASADNFWLYLISGIVPWLFLTESMTKGVIAISSNSALVKQVVFPIEILPVKSILSTLIPFVLNLSILSVVSFCLNGFSPLVFMLPYLIFFLLMFTLGVVFVLSALGTILKDLKDIVQVFSSIGVYLVPIVYVETWMPVSLQPLAFLNPFIYIIFCFQDVFYYGDFQHPKSWIMLPLISMVICFVGFSLFRKIKLSLGNFL